MKHIKKKLLFQRKLDDKEYAKFMETPDHAEIVQDLAKNDFSDYYALAVTSKKYLIQKFKYKRNNKIYLIPEPNPIVIYFSNAQAFLKGINEERNKLFILLETKNIDQGKIINSFYSFYSSVSNFIISLFNSIEAFINLKIPDDFKYDRILKKNTETFNSEQVKRHIQIEEKIKQVIPEILGGKKFHQEFSDKYEKILELKNFRDSIVHTKSEALLKPNYYQSIFTTSLDFDCSQIIHVVRDFINYYENGLIEECDCGKKE